MLIWAAHSRSAMAMADPKRAPGGLGGADGGGVLRARQDAAQALQQARPDSGGALGLAECDGKPAGGRAIEGYDVLADLKMFVEGKGDDACEARLDAWIDARADEQLDRRLDRQLHELANRQLHELANRQLDRQLHELAHKQALAVGDHIFRDLVRAYCLPPIPDSP